ncbi:MAG TPA: alpha/beta hydrolase [Chitinophagaceae bacterium]|nr:alpha/beta hydrolase [Chitinophagaceae bacterium]
MKKIMLLILILVPVTFLMAQTVMPLYEKVPNSKPSPNREENITTDNVLRISKVSVPTLTMYVPSNINAKKAAVIICPGGGYARLSVSHEGSDIAKVFNDWGITAFVLKYRLPNDTIMIDKSIGPLQDAQRAIQMVRENAAKWNIDPARIGIMGFSAGGHLASTASTHFNNAVVDNPSNISSRPDFSILIYPVISFTDSLAHMGSRTNLIGKSPSSQKIIEYCSELQVTPQTPPAFLVHAGDDKTVKVENSVRYYLSLLKNNVGAELHLYPKGGHGFGMNNKTTSDLWMERLKNWLVSSGWIE